MMSWLAMTAFTGTKSLMKNLLKQTAAASMILMISGLAAQSAQNLPASSYEWRFGTIANPALPEVSAGGSAQASIGLGQFASGWMSTNAILGSAQGIWDLGRRGTITLSNPSGLAGNLGQERLVTISVVQYQDGSIYNQLADISIPGASLVSSGTSTESVADIGDWVVAQTQWKVPAGASADFVQITSAYNGSLVNGVTVESTSASVSAPQLSIRPLGAGNGVEISWPDSYTGWVLESTDNAADANGWTLVGGTVQTSGGLHFVQKDASDSARFYRLKQP